MQRVIEVIRATNKPSGVGILLDNSGSTPPLCRFHRFSSAFVKFFFFPVEFQVYVSIRWTTSGRIRKEKEEGNIWEINLRLFRRCAGYFRAISQSELPFSLSFLSIRMFSNGILAFVTILASRDRFDVVAFSLYLIVQLHFPVFLLERQIRCACRKT